MGLFKHRLLGVLALLASTCSVQGDNSTNRWWHEPFGMFQTNLRDIDYNMDTNATADYIVRHGAVAWLQSVGGILAQYPTDLDFHTRNPYLTKRPGGDVVRDTITAARPRGLRVLGRMDFSKVQKPVAEAHPEWLYISPKGEWQTHSHDVVSVCPSGGWYQERVFDIMGEVMDRYELDGFFVNWASFNERDYSRVYHGVCHCDSCKARWADYPGANGKELPVGPESDNYAEWKIFSDGIIQEWADKVQKFIAERNPNAGFISSGNSGDLKFYEANNAIDRDIWHHATSETTSKYMSHRPDVPILINSASFIDHAYRLTAEENQHYGQYHLQAISRGANPSTYIVGTPDKLPFPNLKIASEIVNFHKKWRDVYAGFQPVAKAGLVLPQASQMNETRYAEALSEYKGLYKSLMELHVPFDVIAQENIKATAQNGGLARYEVVVLPNLGQLRDADAEILDEWVAEGGILIASGAVGVAGGDGNGDGTLQLKSAPATRQREFRVGDQLWSTYMAPEQDRTAEDFYTFPLIPLLGSYGLYEWKAGSRGRYKQLGFAPFAPMEYVAGNRQIDERGAGFGPYGNGTGVLVSFPVGYGYREMGLSQFRDFFELVLDEAGVKRQFEFDLAPQVEVTVHVNAKGQTVLHLLNLSGIRYQNFGAYLPIPEGSVKIAGAGCSIKARSLVRDAALEVTDGKIKLPALDLFDVIVIEGVGLKPRGRR